MSTPPLLFLYQTRTILRCRRQIPTTTLSRASLHLTTARRRRGDASINEIPFVKDGPRAGRPGQDDGPRGTITPAERQTFERIFADIEQRGLKPNMQQDPSASSLTARQTTNLILEQAALGASQERTRAHLISTVTADAAKEKQRALQSFPPSLRAAASRAFRLVHPDHPAAMLEPDEEFVDEGEVEGEPKVEGAGEQEWQVPAESMAELDAKRDEEQKRLEGLLSAARSDFELWDVMEREVFSYPDKLGLRRQFSQEQQPERQSQPDLWLGGKRARARLVVNSMEPSEDSAVASDQKMNLYTYGPLYPSFLLYGLRRLDRAFSTPSPLALSVLPRIKALGLESFVVGISTPLYNELLGIYYRRYGDLAKILELLAEMVHSGIGFDKDTAAILHAAHGELSALGDGSNGNFPKAFMSMPEYERLMRDRLKKYLVAATNSRKAHRRQRSVEMD